MTPEQQAAYVNAMAACVIAEVAGMQAANRAADATGDLPPFDSENFRALINNYGIHHNAVLSLFHGS